MAISRTSPLDREDYQNIAHDPDDYMRCQSCLLVMIWSLHGLFIYPALRNMEEKEQFFAKYFTPIAISLLLMAAQGFLTLLIGSMRSKCSLRVSIGFAMIIVLIQLLIAILSGRISNVQLRKATLATAVNNNCLILLWSFFYCRLYTKLVNHQNEFESNRNSMKTKWLSLFIASKQACIGFILMDILLRGIISDGQQAVFTSRLKLMCVILITIHWVSDICLIRWLRVFKKVTRKELKTTSRIIIVLFNIVSFIISMLLLFFDKSELRAIKYTILVITILIFVGESILYVLILDGAYNDNEVIADNDSHDNPRSENPHSRHNSHSSDDESCTQNTNQYCGNIDRIQESDIRDDPPPRYSDIFPNAEPRSDSSTLNLESHFQNTNQASVNIDGIQESDIIDDPPPSYFDIFQNAALRSNSSTLNLEYHPHGNQSNNGSFSTPGNSSSNPEMIPLTVREPVMLQSDIEETYL